MVPLSYQISEFDCGPTTLRNALAILYDPDDINPEIIHYIGTYTLDGIGPSGNIGSHGTSEKAMKKIVDLINKLYIDKRTDLYATYINDKNIIKKEINNYLNNNGVIIARVYLDKIDHYVLITKIEAGKIYLFDPYYDKESYNTQVILNNHFYNRIIDEEVLYSNKKDNFSLVKNNIECILLERRKLWKN